MVVVKGASLAPSVFSLLWVQGLLLACPQHALHHDVPPPTALIQGQTSEATRSWTLYLSNCELTESPFLHKVAHVRYFIIVAKADR